MRGWRFFFVAALPFFVVFLTAAGDLRAAGLSKEEKKLVDAIDGKRAEIIDALAGYFPHAELVERRGDANHE